MCTTAQTGARLPRDDQAVVEFIYRVTFFTVSALNVLSMELVPPNREKMTGSAIKVLSIKLVPPNRKK